MTKEKAAVVILNFNGKPFLEKYLHQVIEHSKPYPVIVADNASTDDSLHYLQTHHPELRVIHTGGNHGYAGGYNKALQEVQADYYILLNSDVMVSEHWLDAPIALMEQQPNVAACQPKILDVAKPDTFEYAGASGGYIDKYGYPFCRGRVFDHLEKDQAQYDQTTEIFWATGACLFVRATAFHQVGGFDEDYFAHMEEIDLCWRLKNFGHNIMVVPASRIYHVGGGTLNKLSSRKTYLNFRNNLATFTKNHPPQHRRLKIFYRMILDGVAAFKFLLNGQPTHFFAVLKAHGSYYTWLPKLRAKRKQLEAQKNFRYCWNQVYNGNIVWEFYIRGIKTFSELKRGFF